MNAGLKVNDVIIQMGSRMINSHVDLDGFFVNYFVGDSIPVTVMRQGKKVTVNLVLKEFPGA
jgi:S1-C subfamily serine protease